MKIMTPEYRDRVKHWLRVLQDDFYTPIMPVEFEAARTMEQLSLEEAKELPFSKVSPGFVWGDEWEYCWFRGTVTLPEQARDRRIVMDLQPGGESTIMVNGRAFGTYRAPWVSIPAHYLVDNCLARFGVPGESYEIMMETYAGHDFPSAPNLGCAIGPVLPGKYGTDPVDPGMPESSGGDVRRDVSGVPGGNRRVLGSPTIGIWDEDAYQLYLDADTLLRLLETMDDTTLRAVKTAQALEEFTRIVDFEQDKEKRTVSYRQARQALKPLLEAVNGSTVPRFHAIGNAHLDLAWLWPMAETYRKTARTFAAQLRLLEEYPEYRYLQSQPAAYEMCRQYYPELFERIRQAIREGRWIADGAMWVEPDTNLAGGEALVRQLLYGLAYYEEVLGVQSRVLWLPDTFGYTGALPQILKKSGVDYLVTQKIFWSYNDGERFPYHYFYWEGMDGSKVTAFLPTSYTYQTDPAEINHVWKNRTQVRDLDAFLLPFGYGDGGGGPARDHVEYLEREKNLEGMPMVKQGSPLEFFMDLEEKDGGPKNTYHGELYFDAHRGTYTTQARIKKNNRKAELALREMEIWGAAAMALIPAASGSEGETDPDTKYDVKEAGDLWKEVLLHQFHDILPGSGIARIYHEADRRVKAVIAAAEKKGDYAAGWLASWMAIAGKHTEEADGTPCMDETDPVSIFNSLSFSRNALVDLPESFAEGAVTGNGDPVLTEITQDGVKALVTVPSLGSVSVYPGKNRLSAAEPEDAAAKAYECGGDFVMENSRIMARINRRGEITSFILKTSGREFAAAPMNVFHLYKDVPRMYDAWDIDANYIEQETTALESVSVSIEKAEGIYAALRVTGVISRSVFTQTIMLAAESGRIEFITRIDWKELHRLLKVAFPADVHAENAINEMQFGYAERPTKRSRQYEKDRFEVCNHRYSALCDNSHGIAVLNDCKYGISMNENALELTLLRAAASPEMRTDNHVHEFTYAVTAFEGTFADSDVVRQGLELNVPVRVICGAPADFSLVQVDRENIILETMKPAENGSGDVVLRFYEAKKAAVTARIITPFDGWRAWLCDLRENRLEEISCEHGIITVPFKAFEIVTIVFGR